MDTLVLNAHYMPVNQVNWQTALSWVVSGRATVLPGAEYDDWFVRSPSRVWRVPAVIRLLSGATGWLSKQRGVRFNRKNLWLRDKGQCGYCGNKLDLRDATLDHVIPRSMGGKTVWDNVVTACLDCNQKKADRTPDQARMKLRVKPRQPMVVPGGFLPTFADGMPPSWRDFLKSASYWGDELEP